jgi:hypothetical protein
MTRVGISGMRAACSFMAGLDPITLLSVLKFQVFPPCYPWCCGG